MEVIYEGSDIYPDISVNYCYHNMYTRGRADTVELRLNDTRYLWDVWQPKEGDSLMVKEGAATTGQMVITKIRPENGFYLLKAASVPTEKQGGVNQAWENVQFFQVCAEKAAAHGLSFSTHGAEDQTYPYLRQQNQTDFVFLQELCLLESCSFVVFDGSLVVFGERYLEGQAPAGTIQVKPEHTFEYQDRSSQNYAKAIIESGQYTGEFSDETASTSRILRPKRPILLNSKEEGDRFAKGLLREANKGNRAGTLERRLSAEYAAGSIARLETEGETSWDGTVFFYQLRHDYVHRKTKLFFRHPLEGEY